MKKPCFVIAIVLGMMTILWTNPILASDEKVHNLVYQWLCQQQDNNTGLLPSQEGDSASTYNNALAIISFISKSDNGKAKRILDHFNNRCNESEFYKNNEPYGFFQFRNSKTGSPDTNCNRWMGDNSWLLVAIHHYKSLTADTTYDSMANAILDFLKSLQRADGHIASGWEKGDNYFNDSGSAEGNLDAYKALSLFGEITAADKILHWLDFNDLDWKNGPLDIHSWRVLSLGARYGFCLNDTEKHKRTINYYNTKVTGFVPFVDLNENIWTEGTGQIAVSFYKAGYEKKGNYYVKELEKLLFEPPNFQKTKTLSFLALADHKNYPWVDTAKGHVAAACWYMYAKSRFDPMDGVIINSFEIQDPVYQIQAENYDDSNGPVREDDRGILYEGRAIHIAGDDNKPDVDNSGWAEYVFKILPYVYNGTISMRYADDIAGAPLGDTCKILLDGKLVKSFNTNEYSIYDWDTFVWTDAFPIESTIEPGSHTIKVEGIDNNTYGFTIDCFRIQGEAKEGPNGGDGGCFIQALSRLWPF